MQLLMMNNATNLYLLAYPLFNLLTKQICMCECIIEEHNEQGICYGLKYNGIIYSSCSCKRFKPLGINLNLYSEMEFNDGQNN
jgi:hypothetical protein